MGSSAHEQPTTHLPSLDGVPRRPAVGSLTLFGVTAILALMVAMLGGYALYNQGRVAPQVRVAGLDISGRSRAEAAALVEAHLTRYMDTPVALVAPSGAWELKPRQLGISYDPEATVAAAMGIGRSGPFSQRLAAWWPRGASAAEIEPVGALDQAGLLAGLEPLLSEVNRTPVDAQVTLAPEVGLAIEPSAPGQRLDLGSLTAELRLRTRSLSTQPVPLTLHPMTPATIEQDLAPLKEAADALLGQPFILEGDARAGRAWTIEPDEMRPMLTVRGEDRRVLALEESRLAALLTRLAGDLDEPSRDATLTLDDSGQAVLEPHRDGVALNVPATVAAINEAIGRDLHSAALTIETRPATVTSADLESTRAHLEALLDRSVTLTADDVSRTLDRKALASLLELAARPGQDATATVTADEEAITSYLTSLAREVNREALPPSFKYLGGAVQQVADPVQGRKLDIAAATAAVSATLLAPDQTAVTLLVTRTDAQTVAVRPEDIIIRDVLGSGQTYYGFSLPDRKHNVELATERLNGTLIAPGEVFSFNRAVGRVNTATGYRTGYGIILTNGAVQTVPSVGGGICQVATTVFHAAFKAGVPIIERNWHLYWIPTYGEPSGLTGLDATVDEDYGLDFTFRNTTGNWMALESSFDGQNMAITLRGVNPGWQVRVAGPVISNVTKHDPKMVFRDDPSLPKGQRVQVETARDGMDVSITRSVLKDGAVVDERTFNSHYSPSQNVTLVGTGG